MLTVYANRLIVQIKEQGDGTFPITPVQGTYIVGGSQVLGAFFTFLYAGRIGRRPVFIIGYFLMALVLFVCGLSMLME